MKKRQKTSFANIVQAVVDTPTTRTQHRLPPGRHGNLLVTRDRQRWILAAESVEPEVARRLVATGALLAHDACGCGGTCGIELLDSEIALELPEVGSPEISTDPRHPGWLSHWTSEDDPTVALVLASGRVTWGRALA